MTGGGQFVGGPLLFRQLRTLADLYRAKAVEDLDYNAASIAIALNTLCMHASNVGQNIQVQVLVTSDQ